MLRQICIVFNPISGKGGSKKRAHSLSQKLETAGHRVTLRPSQRHYPTEAIGQILKDTDLLIVAGGDGTLLPFLEPASRLDVPLCMYPTGNQSLFAQYFKISPNEDEFIRSINNPKLEEHYFSVINQQAFFCMASVGLDAAIVEEVSKTRNGPIGNLGYVLPTIKALWSSTPDSITLRADGETLIDEQHGYLIVANTPSYALGLKLVPQACSNDKTLHATFYSTTSNFKILWFFCKALLRFNPGSDKNVKSFKATQFEITSGATDVPVQADGDLFGTLPVSIEKSLRPIKVLVPT